MSYLAQLTAHIAWRVVQTHQWCELQRNRGTGNQPLLLPALRPYPATVESSDFWLSVRDERARQDMVESLASLRAHLLSKTKQAQLTASGTALSGKLLVFCPDETLSDGAANIASQGFFDAGNAPPWDTWVYYVTGSDADKAKGAGLRASLLSWVPTNLVALVDAGVRANPEACIVWARDVAPHFILQLEQSLVTSL